MTPKQIHNAVKHAVKMELSYSQPDVQHQINDNFPILVADNTLRLLQTHDQQEAEEERIRWVVRSVFATVQDLSTFEAPDRVVEDIATRVAKILAQ